MTKTLVFTDMDGTLLDHHTYSFEAAKPALTALEKKDIPVIPTTSKTFAELQPLRESIGLDGPFIIENGAAIFIPHGFFKQKPSGTVWIDGYWCKAFISNKNYWIKLLEKIGSEFDGKYKQFSKMSIQEILFSEANIFLNFCRLQIKIRWLESLRGSKSRSAC